MSMAYRRTSLSAESDDLPLFCNLAKAWSKG